MTVSASVTVSASLSVTVSASVSVSASLSLSLSLSLTASASLTVSASVSASPTTGARVTPTVSVSPLASASPTALLSEPLAARPLGSPWARRRVLHSCYRVSANPNSRDQRSSSSSIRGAGIPRAARARRASSPSPAANAAWA